MFIEQHALFTRTGPQGIRQVPQVIHRARRSRRQTGVTFLGGVQGRHVPGQIVITGPGRELGHAHRHTHPKGYKPPARSGRPELLPAVLDGRSDDDWADLD
jgi:hypothetical protein